MAAMALPIRELSASVQYEAAYAQKTFWKVVDGKARATTFDVVLWVEARLLSRAMSKLASLQGTLIEHLTAKDCQGFDTSTFDKVASDLERIVSMTHSFLDDAYEMPEKCLAVWRPQLDLIADRTAHLDNFAESLRIASNEACTALLADMATQITTHAAQQALLGIR